MKVLLVGAHGLLGSAVHKTLTDRGHDVVTAGRSQGDVRVDITDPDDVTRLYDTVGAVDAVASAAGTVPYKPISEMTTDDYHSAYIGKVQAQVELVRQGVGRIAERGSFTLITGILAREPILTGSAASLAGGAVEAFVRAAAIEIVPQRINAVSPSVFTEALDVYGDFFPGFAPVALSSVAQAYVKSIEGPATGQVIIPV